jgi:hypothetical protein
MRNQEAQSSAFVDKIKILGTSKRSHNAQRRRPKSSIDDMKTGAQTKPGEQTRGDAPLGRASLSALLTTCGLLFFFFFFIKCNNILISKVIMPQKQQKQIIYR